MKYLYLILLILSPGIFNIVFDKNSYIELHSYPSSVIKKVEQLKQPSEIFLNGSSIFKVAPKAILLFKDNTFSLLSQAGPKNIFSQNIVSPLFFPIFFIGILKIITEKKVYFIPLILITTSLFYLSQLTAKILYIPISLVYLLIIAYGLKTLYDKK